MDPDSEIKRRLDGFIDREKAYETESDYGPYKETVIVKGVEESVEAEF